jgi:hypothetical protein
MKIIDTDNFGGDYPNEKIIAENIKSEEFAVVMADALNDIYCSSDYSPRFYKVVDDDYVLQPGFEP